MQKDLFVFHKCGDEFDLRLDLSDLDILVLHRVVVRAAVYSELSPFLAELIAYTSGVMDLRQREWYDFEEYSFMAMDNVVARSEEHTSELQSQ